VLIRREAAVAATEKGRQMGFFNRDNDNGSAKSTAKADFSNVEGGSSSTAPAPAPVDAPVSTAGKRYTVVSGDSLSRIAKREYGDANEWHRIFEANRDIIKDPDLIHPGQSLAIPPKA